MKKIGLLFRETSENYITNNIKESNSVFIVKYSGVSSPGLTALRQSLVDSSALFFVVKNSVTRRVLKNSGFDDLEKCVDGPCGMVFIKEDPTEASRVLYNFSRQHQDLRLQGGFLKDRILTGDDIERLARLPSKKILRAQTLFALKSPITGLAIVLNQTLRKFVVCLEEIKKKKTG